MALGDIFDFGDDREAPCPGGRELVDGTDIDLVDGTGPSHG
jgi:hypothetical protein